MASFNSLVSLARLGGIHPELAALTWKLKRTRRTYLSFATLHSLAHNYMLVRQRHPQPLQVAEFGVGRGGSAALLAWLVGHFGGKLTLYDVFGRIPAPTEQDGARAQDRYQVILNQEGQEYYGNIPDLLQVVLKDLHAVCDPARIEIVQGKYEDTLTRLDDQRAFSQVHIDCDWYESSMAVYHYLQERLRPGAIVQVDDYSNWDGSSRAFEDAGWLSQYYTWIVDGALVIDTARS